MDIPMVILKSSPRSSHETPPVSGYLDLGVNSNGIVDHLQVENPENHWGFQAAKPGDSHGDMTKSGSTSPWLSCFHGIYMMIYGDMSFQKHDYQWLSDYMGIMFSQDRVDQSCSNDLHVFQGFLSAKCRTPSVPSRFLHWAIGQRRRRSQGCPRSSWSSVAMDSYCRAGNQTWGSMMTGVPPKLKCVLHISISYLFLFSLSIFKSLAMVSIIFYNPFFSRFAKHVFSIVLGKIILGSSVPI